MERVITFGYNGDGYGEYNAGFTVRLKSDVADTPEEMLELCKQAAQDYYQHLKETEGYELPYPWNWGDVFTEVEIDYFIARGVHVMTYHGCTIYPSDEIVLSD